MFITIIRQYRFWSKDDWSELELFLQMNQDLASKVSTITIYLRRTRNAFVNLLTMELFAYCSIYLHGGILINCCTPCMWLHLVMVYAFYKNMRSFLNTPLCIFFRSCYFKIFLIEVNTCRQWILIWNIHWVECLGINLLVVLYFQFYMSYEE